MDILVTGLILFFAVHSISIISEPWRNRMVRRIGEMPWQGIYSVLAIIGFILIVQGYGIARQNPVILYTPPSWLRHITLILMIFVFPLLFATYIPGKIRDTVKHPMLLAVKIWAVAHLLVNGSLADVVLFGSFLAWAVADRISMKHRIQRPVTPIKSNGFNDVIALILGMVVYVLFVLWLHAWLIGVSPI